MLRHNDNKTAAVKKHLILFFDVNGTIMLEDSKQNKDKETAICQMLAESYSSCWKPGMNKNMTYRKFVEEHMHPGDDNDPVIEAARHASYRNFLTFLKESNHSLHAVVNESYQKFQADFSSKNKIFDSFVALIEHLEHEKIPYTVIFRTFGNDIDSVIEELRQRTVLKSFSRSSFSAERLQQLDSSAAAKILSDIKPGEHSAWQDNWPYWHSLEEKFEGGKPFFIDLNNPDQLTMFFDDHALGKQILCVRTTQEGKYNQRLLQEKLAAAGRIVPVNKLEANQTRDYYINKIDTALRTPLNINHEECLNAADHSCRLFGREKISRTSEQLTTSAPRL